MSTESWEQSPASVSRNIGYFGHGTRIARLQRELEIYQLARLAVTRELRGVRRLLDVGSGGVFNYATEDIGEIVACDLVLEDGHAVGLPNVTLRAGSVLELPFPDGAFDGVLAQNVLHHVVGRTVSANERNMVRALAECARVLAPGGKLVLVESTVPAWFYRVVQRPMYGLLAPVWRLDHPLTFQFTRRMLVDWLVAQSLRIDEQAIIPRGRWVIQFGWAVPTAMTPIQLVKLVGLE